MKAWERERRIMDEAMPVILTEEEQTWDLIEGMEKAQDDHLKILWKSHVPGSYAPESIMTAAVQSMENMGYELEGTEELLDKGFAAYDGEDMPTLHQVSAMLWHKVRNAKKNEKDLYWQYGQYDSFDDYNKEVRFEIRDEFVVTEELREKLYAGWLAQIIGGAMGTAMEGYTTANIKKVFGEVRSYVRKPNTYNDDITYELAFLKAFQEKGFELEAMDIALEWAGLIPFGWSAEEIALNNIKRGVFPPESGYEGNPFREWIGAQMRGAICGMVAPGNPREAARLAWMDGSVSHAGNGILGEIFNAVLVSLSFVEKDIRKILKESITCIPDESEYHAVITFAHRQATQHENWEEAWHACEVYLKEYNWVHAYPNAAAEVLALYYGQGDFEETLHLIAMMGQDVDCNAAQIMTAIGIMHGVRGIPSAWSEPIGDQLDTYVRTMKSMSITKLGDWTYDVVKKWHRE